MQWTLVGAIVLGCAVMIGAFGAHALRDRLDAYATGIYERAVFYHNVHGLGLVAIGLAAATKTAALAPAAVAGWLLLAGILVFSGSLYALALTGNRRLGAITPLGGVALVAGWFAFAYACATATAP